MKTLLRIAVALVIGCVFAAVALYDAAREARKKRKLGAAYEGPLDGWDN